MRAIMKLAVLTVAVLAAKRTYAAVSRARAGASNNSGVSGAYPEASNMNASPSNFAQNDAI